MVADIGTTKASLDHVRVKTRLGYEQLVRAFEAELGRLDPQVVKALVERHASWSEVKEAIAGMAGPHGLMIIFVADQGAITSLSGKAKRCSLYIVGNPVIANDILDVSLGAGFHVPFRVALYDGVDGGGAVITYDRPSSFLATLGMDELKPFGTLLDGKIEAVVAAVQRA